MFSLVSVVLIVWLEFLFGRHANRMHDALTELKERIQRIPLSDPPKEELLVRDSALSVGKVHCNAAN